MDEHRPPIDVRQESPPAAPGLRLGQPAINAIAELVADLLEPTQLVALDRLAAARGRAGQGSLAQALRDEGLALDSGVARALAERYHLPFVDIATEHLATDALDQIPIAVLERLEALPYRLAEGTLA